MDAELRRRVDALRRPLELAAADGFAGVRRVAGLGHALRAACDGLIARVPSAPLAHWRSVLGEWETLDEDRQAVEVARGMRLVRTVGGQSAAAASTAPPLAAPRAKKPKPAASESGGPGAPADSLDPLDPLGAATSSLPGIGPAFAERLAARGLETVEDLLWMVPRRYDDVRSARSLASLDLVADGERTTFVARVVSARMIFARGRRWAEVRLAAAELLQPGAAVVRWFNVWAGIDKRMPPDSIVTLSGPIKRRGGKLELANPDIIGIVTPEPANDAASAKPAPTILTRYPDIAGVPPSRLRQACAIACARVAAIADDGVPPAIAIAADLPSLAAALGHLHAPPAEITADELVALNRGDSRWQRRLAFGELFALGVAVAQRRRARRGDAAVPCPPHATLPALLARALPFAPTGAQHRAIAEIAADLARDVPMNRLLQGDVGAGKTAVAFAAALHVARAGRQVAVMAPTELLAEQHAATWRRWATAGALGLRIELLTASTPRGVRQSLIALAAAGQVDVLIGTHALLADGVGFAALGLAIVDEQHRFGVAQRARLRAKDDGQGAPHLLVMTATPIPRTLALTAYGDLDVAVLDELPPGRQPIATRVLVGARGRREAEAMIAARVAAGERVYVVCPKVEASDELDDAPGKAWADATTVAGELAAALPAVRVGLVHGRLDTVARDRVMRAFRDGELDALVATTVIEVGVDVPEATVMVIHDADRFGLAQLHQLRGRVGRGGGAAACLLLSHDRVEALGPDGAARLTAMCQTTDGFRIAEQDLALRGPGELFGDRQAGAPRLRFGTLAQHTELLLDARRHAEALLDADPELVRPEHAALRRALDRRLASRVFGAEAG